MRCHYASTDVTLGQRKVRNHLFAVKPCNELFSYKNFCYICGIGNWERQQEVKKEGWERDKSRRENLGKFFYDLAKLTFAGLVIGGIVSFSPDMENIHTVYRVVVGGASTLIFAWIGNKILK